MTARALTRLAPRTAARRLALAWAVATFAGAAATAPAQGVGRDEGVYVWAAESYAGFWAALPRAPARALAGLDAAFAPNHEHPPLTKDLYGLTHALFHRALGWTGWLQGFRMGAFLFAALLSWLLAATGHELAGLLGGLLAPALFWAVPRHFHHAHIAALDLPIAALWLATVVAYRRATRAEPGPRTFALACVAGLAFGLAIATKHNAWFLPPLLGVHALLLRLRVVTGRARARAAFLALAAMAVIGPLVLAATWPWLWHDPAARLRAYFQFHLRHEHYAWLYFGRLLREPPFPVAYPFVVTALTVPAAVLACYAGGLAHAVGRLFRAVRSSHDAPRPDHADELLWLLAAVFPIALIAWPTVPHFGGVKHWLPAMPFLALLGARALASAGRALWPARGGWVTAALGLAALAPGVLAVARVHPYGTAAYNELAGGAPGAATLGLQRQFWGDDVVGLLGELNAHAAPGARVWWQETGPLAVQAWQRDGRVRADLRWADGPEDADVSVWHFHQEFRDKEYRTWTAFAVPTAPGEPARLPRPVAGLYLDEVPLVTVYARPGAWR